MTDTWTFDLSRYEGLESKKSGEWTTARARLQIDAPHLLALVQTLTAERDRLREALAFYADKRNWAGPDEDAWLEAEEADELTDEIVESLLSAVETDCGNRARAALAEGEGNA